MLIQDKFYSEKYFWISWWCQKQAEGALEGRDINSAFRYMLPDFHRRSIQNIDALNYVNSKLILLGTGKLISESCVY